MSLSFQNKFTKSPVEASSGSGTENASSPPKKGKKFNPLLSAKTDDYVDDVDLYKPKITRQERYDYYQELLAINKDRKDSNHLIVLDEIHYYPKPFVWVFAFVRSNRWDHWYLDFMLLFLALVIIFTDGLAENYVPMLVTLNANNNLLMVPLALMFVCQVIPLFGTVFFVHFCNDLVRLIASNNFQQWAFVSCLTAQYVEYFYYGGRNRREKAGRIRRGEVSRFHQIKVKLIEFMERFTKKGAKIKPEDIHEVDNDVNQDSDDEESDLSDEESSAMEKNRTLQIGEDGEKEKTKPATEVAIKVASTQNSEIKKGERPQSPKHHSDLENGTVGTDDNDKKKDEEDITQNPEDYMDWLCIVCNTANRGLKHNPEPKVDVYFGEKGVLYRRMYANLVFHSPKPTCRKCYTICDYVPPPGSAHIFPHNPEPHVAFSGYPKKHLLIHGLETDNNPKDDGKRRIIPPKYMYNIISFFYGKKNDPTSVPMLNDWRLRKYILHHFPKIPKYEIKPTEQYEVGEIVECRQQKSEFCRARVLEVHGNDTYDIKYDGGDECRFVLRKDIRLGTEKRSFAYRVEMMAVVLTVSFPLCLMMVISTSNFGLTFLTMFLLSLALLLVRIKSFVQYAYNYIDGGICVIFRFTMFFLLPLFFFFLTSIIGVTSGKDPKNWITITALSIITKLFSLPVLYVMRPVYGVIGLLIFLQTSVGMVLLTIFANTTSTNRGTVLIPIIPFITTVLTLKYLRKELHNIWDTCFVIRPRIEDKKSNPSIYKSMYKSFDTAWANFKASYF